MHQNKPLKALLNFSCCGVEGAFVVGDCASKGGKTILTGQHSWLLHCEFA